jgi:hypothetical protein
MRALILLLLVSFALVECKKDDDPDPLEGINEVWLNATIADIEKSSTKEEQYIVKADYEGTCIVYWATCCANCNWAIIPYRCDTGAKIDNVDSTKITGHTVIWKPEGSTCNFQ